MSSTRPTAQALHDGGGKAIQDRRRRAGFLGASHLAQRPPICQVAVGDLTAGSAVREMCLQSLPLIGRQEVILVLKIEAPALFDETRDISIAEAEG